MTILNVFYLREKVFMQALDILKKMSYMRVNIKANISSFKIIFIVSITTSIPTLQKNSNKEISKHENVKILTHFSPMSHFYTVFRGYRNVTLD